jgi:hypothetical protein
MELGFDWMGYQDIFYPRLKQSADKSGFLGGAIFLVTEGDEIFEVLSENEDLSEWLGQSYANFSEKMKHRRITRFTRAQLDQATQEALKQPHFHKQVNGLREATQVPFLEHFLIDLVRGGWSRILPSSYGLYVRIDGKREQHFLTVVRRGQIEGFEKPDFATLGILRPGEADLVVEQLSERLKLPVQGIVVPEAVWVAWSQSDQPWRAFAESIRSQKAKLVPFRWALISVAAARGYFGV